MTVRMGKAWNRTEIDEIFEPVDMGVSTVFVCTECGSDRTEYDRYRFLYCPDCKQCVHEAIKIDNSKCLRCRNVIVWTSDGLAIK